MYKKGTGKSIRPIEHIYCEQAVYSTLSMWTITKMTLFSITCRDSDWLGNWALVRQRYAYHYRIVSKATPASSVIGSGTFFVFGGADPQRRRKEPEEAKKFWPHLDL